MSTVYILFFVFRFVNVVRCQVTGLGRYGCRKESGISVLPACDSLNATMYSCLPSGEDSALNQSCFCQQGVVNNIFDCESEFRLCYQNDQFDYYAESVIQNWHTQCDSYITFTPTTPVLSNPTTTIPTLAAGTIQPFCTNFLTSCASWSLAEARCWALDYNMTASSALDCACSTSLLSLASVCLYDTNITCYGLDAHLSAVPLFNICGKTYSNDQIVTAQTASSAVTEISTTATPGISPSSAVSQTSVASQVTSVSPSAAHSASSALPSTGSASLPSIDIDYCATSILVMVLHSVVWSFI